jgi:hypothetical protein
MGREGSAHSGRRSVSGARGRLGKGRLLSSLAWGVLVMRRGQVGEWASGRSGGRGRWRRASVGAAAARAHGAGAPVAGAEVFPDLFCHSSLFDSFLYCERLFVVNVDKCR